MEGSSTYPVVLRIDTTLSWEPGSRVRLPAPDHAGTPLNGASFDPQAATSEQHEQTHSVCRNGVGAARSAG